MPCLEDLSSEILMLIFEYMDMEDIWTIFLNMNTKFHRILLDSRLRLTVNTTKLNQPKFDELCCSIFKQNSINIHSLTLINNYLRYSQIRQLLFHTSFIYFQSLYSLTLIDVNYDELVITAKQIKQLPNLNSLYVNTHEIFHRKQLMDVTQGLFNQSHIRVLYINLHEVN